MSKFPSICLVTVQHDQAKNGRVYEHSPVLVGRSTETHVSILDPSVSRLHLEIQWKEDRIWVTDLGSANGTFHNGQRIEPKTKVAYAPGDVLEVGTKRIPIILRTYEKGFQAKAVDSSGDVSKQEKADLKLFIESAHAEASRLDELAKKQADQLLKTSEAKGRQILAEFEAKGAKVLEEAKKQADLMNAQVDQRVSLAVVEAEKAAMLASQNTFAKAETMLEEARVKSKDILHEAEAKSLEAQRKGQDEAKAILDQARQAMSELRLSWERERSHLQAEADKKENVLMEDARKQASAIVEEGERKRHAMILEAEENSKRILGETEDQKSQIYMDLEAKKIQTLAEIEWQQKNAHQKALEQHKQIIDEANSFAQKIRDGVVDAQALLEKRKTEVAETDRRLIDLQGDVRQNEARLQASSKTLAELAEAKKKLEELRKEAEVQTEKRKSIVIEIEGMRQQWENNKKALEVELRTMRDQTFKSVEEFKAQEQKGSNQRKLEELKSLKELRSDAEKSLNRHRTELINELILAAEAQMLAHLKPALPPNFDWGAVSERVKSEIQGDLEEKVYTWTKGTEDEEMNQVVAKTATKVKSRFKYGSMVTAGLIAVLMAIPFTRAAIMEFLQKNSQDSAVANFTHEMQTERDRRYVPQKVKTWLPSYSDSVLYTDGFTDWKLEAQAQDRWIKDLHEHLYRKLRVEEDAIIRLVSYEAALVTKLKEQAEQIHPDHVQEKISKMKEFEKESVNEMVKIIGSKEKYDKFQDFAKSYYYDRFANRTPAQAPATAPTPASNR